MNKLFCISGPSGVGKTTLLNSLMKNERFLKLRRTTTRQIRPNEGDNEYHFISKGSFLSQKQNNNFIYTESYDSNFYAIEKQMIVDFFNCTYRTGLIISGIQGAIKLKEIYKQKIVIIYIYVAEKQQLFSFDNSQEIEILKRRLENKFSIQYPYFKENTMFELVNRRNELNIKELLFVKENITYRNDIDFVINATDKISLAVNCINKLIEKT